MCAYTSREIFAVLMPGPKESQLQGCWVLSFNRNCGPRGSRRREGS